ncbi:MAG: hydroxymethylbilane synthase [Deltaproteobacteria bacterium]|nr:hydroxymethylbilane synthase [Deltaproteobacteria bacterium]
MTRQIKIGTRGSRLALWQAGYIKSEIEKLNPQYNVTVTTIKTKGDIITDVPLAKIGGKGLFVKEIELALLNNQIDIAVHSLKDMPSVMPNGLCIGAIPKRENPQDILVSKNNIKLSELKTGAVIGTSSLRRATQILFYRPDLKISPLRGNLDTRLKKLQTEAIDGIILAAAGIKRLGYQKHIAEYIDPEIILPAAGQGALCVQIRQEDNKILSVAEKLNSETTQYEVAGERALLHKLEGDCQIPIAAFGKANNNKYALTGLIANTSGKIIIKNQINGNLKDAAKLGLKLAEKLIDMGADDILQEIKNSVA